MNQQIHVVIYPHLENFPRFEIIDWTQRKVEQKKMKKKTLRDFDIPTKNFQFLSNSYAH